MHLPVSNDQKKETPKDNTQTPQYIFDWLNNEFDFDLDGAASEYNAMLPDYCTKEMNLLKKTYCYKTIFINPPYSKPNLKLFTDWAKHAQLLSNTVVMLLPLACLSNAYVFSNIDSFAAEVRIIVGRIEYLKNSKSGVAGGTCVVVYRPQWCKNNNSTHITFVKKPEIIASAKGEPNAKIHN